MKNIRLKAVTSLFMIALCCPFAFADDGDQGSGGLGQPGTSTVKLTVRTPEEGDQGSGGRPTTTTGETYIDSVLVSLSQYFNWWM